MAQQKVVIPIPKGYKPLEREAIAQEIVDFIVERTLKGKDKDNVNFKGYSRSYIKSLDFKIAGKSPSNVNLKLSGDMLASLKVLNTKRAGSVTVGFDASDTENNGKAEGNIKGTYGSLKKTKKDPKTGLPVPRENKKRDFLGITKNDLDKKILANYPLEDKKKLLEQALAVVAAAEKAKDLINE